MPHVVRTALAVVVVMLATLSGARAQEQQLAKLGATLAGVTVSGLSAGAYMAGQFQMAHARMVTGAALIAGGPYGCAASGVFTPPALMAINGCMLGLYQPLGVPNVGLLKDRAATLAGEGAIDPIGEVTGDRIYIFSGQVDSVVVPEMGASAEAFYRALGVPAANIRHIRDVAAGHGMVTMSEGATCNRSESPYVVDCDYDQAGALLTWLIGTLEPPTAGPSGELVSFDQAPFDPDGSATLAQQGAVYVPESCRGASGCRVHIAFHGCGQNRGSVGDAFVAQSGYRRWAETNRLIVLFPDVSASSFTNPQGCWDWWGYTGSRFMTREAPQIVAVRRMLDRLAER